MGAAAVLVGAMLTTAAASPVPARALPAVWAGTLSFDEANLQTKDVPLNVTIRLGQPATAGFSWYFTRSAGTEICRGQLEPTLAWSVSSSGLVTAEGTGANPDFYSFQGQLDGTTDTINGTIYHPPLSQKQACGSFTIRPVSAANPLKPPQCHGTAMAMLAHYMVLPSFFPCPCHPCRPRLRRHPLHLRPLSQRAPAPCSRHLLRGIPPS